MGATCTQSLSTASLSCCHCHQAGSGVQGCGLAPPPASSMPSVPSRAVPQGEGTGTWQQPSPQEKDRATPHPWEAPGGTFLSDHGERGQKGHTKDGINAAFLLPSLWMGNSLLTVPKSYRDTLDINFHITRTSEPPCNAAPLQLAPPHLPPLLWSTQLHLRQYFPISRAPCPVTHALSGQKSAGNCL